MTHARKDNEEAKPNGTENIALREMDKEHFIIKKIILNLLGIGKMGKSLMELCIMIMKKILVNGRMD